MAPEKETLKMNDRYFACPKCCRFTDAGYRWAYWTLEHPGHVSLDAGVDVESLLRCIAYWHPTADDRNDWLEKTILPTVRSFLETHKAHGIVYVESERIHAEDSLHYNWIEVDDQSVIE